MARRNHSSWPFSGAMLVLLFAAAHGCAPATFHQGRSFQRCTDLPVLGATLYWTYHAANGTVDVAFRAPQSTSGWVAWGINTERPGSMVGSSVFVASPDAATGAVSVLMTFLESTSPGLANGTLRLDVTVPPVAEYTAGAYTVYVTVALPGNATQQNTVWQAGALSGGRIAPHPMSGPNLQSTMTLDFLSGGTSTGAHNVVVHRPLLLVAASAAAQQNCSSATFSGARSFTQCATLPVLGASLYWTYHRENGTADVAFRAPQSTNGWVAWGINTQGVNSMLGSSVFVASQDSNGVVSVLMTYLDSTISPALANNTLKFAVPVGPAAEYSGGAYTIFATIKLPGNGTRQNVVWQAGPLVNGAISPHPQSGDNLQSVQALDFLPGGGRTFTRCNTLPVLGASLYWTYRPESGTVDVAFRAPQSTSGWVAWGINTERPNAMLGSSVFVASQDGNGVVSVLMTYLESTAPSLANNTLKLDVPVGPAAEYSGGAYTIYATVALPGNRTLQNMVWQAGPLVNGAISPHPQSGENLMSTQMLDFVSGSRSTGTTKSGLSRRNLRELQG
ncbi:hypothetical protein U9M48_006434 [Paspalum notatum var. saurae]|uniref:DOMON domain-containing protein n=1 Tax=Paspalum notatum var. saurae TaxID=547442 RepID=A0AAQ3PSA2_PASNO